MADFLRLMIPALIGSVAFTVVGWSAGRRSAGFARVVHHHGAQLVLDDGANDQPDVLVLRGAARAFDVTGRGMPRRRYDPDAVVARALNRPGARWSELRVLPSLFIKDEARSKEKNAGRG